MSKIDGHVIVKLYDLLNEYQEERARIDEILSDFQCHLNKDVENFLHNNAVLYEQQGVSRTNLVLASYKNNPVIVGYFSLSNKSIVVKHNKVSTTLKKRIAKFGTSDGGLKQITLSSLLIGQLGKNSKYQGLITGDALLKYACDTVKSAQLIIGGKLVYLECADEPKLIDFYKSNGFVSFGNRQLDIDEKDISTTTLVQMLRYL